jgi:hypothetical protein
MNKIIINICVLLLCATAALADNGGEKQAISISNGYNARRDEAIGLLKGKPLVRDKVIPPIFADGSNFSRGYSYSLLDYAFKCFWLGEDIKGANAALLENANYYIGYPRAYSDKDSFYWGADELCKMLEFYGSHGCIKKGLIDKEVEARIYLMMYQYSKQQSNLAKAEYQKSKTWYVDESENHHIQRFYAAWHFAKLLMKDPKYSKAKYNDGNVAAFHFNAWNKFAKEWMRERGRKGLFIEMANDNYGLETLKGVYNFYDFGDKELSRLSGNLLDLYWAAWAQEQLNGVRGGAKSRVYPYEANKGNTPFYDLAWFYLGANKVVAPHGNLFTMVTSRYRLPTEVVYLALNPEARGNYEIVQRRLGLAEKGFFLPSNYHVLCDSGLVRYSYCTPSFIAGSFFCKALPYESWVLISSQNRWAGVIFSNDKDARIYPSCMMAKDNRAYNPFWCVQHKGSMVFQKLDTVKCSRSCHQFGMWISKAGLSNMSFYNNCVFVESDKAYAAVRCITAYKIVEKPTGYWIVPEEEYAPIILEVGQKTDYKDYTDFKKKMVSQSCSIKDNWLEYHSLSGEILRMDLKQNNLPMVGNKAVNLTPTKVMDSPFLQSDYNSGIITLNSYKKLMINFNK